MSYPPQGNTIDNDFHPSDSGLEASQEDHWGTQLADVQSLHPPGTFAKNTQIGDVVNGVASQLGVNPPKNIIKFPSRK